MAITVSDSPERSASAEWIPAADAFDRWAVARGMRGRDLYDTVAKVMRYWVSFAMAKIPRGDAGKIRQHLETLTTAYSRTGTGGRSRLRGSQTANRLRGTIAAAMAHMLNYKGARLAAAFGDDAGFYARVNQYISARAYSANLYRAGLMPAIYTLGNGRGSDPGNAGYTRTPKYRHPPGSITHRLTDDIAEILVENFASQSTDHPFRVQSSTIETLAGGAFSEALAQVAAMVAEFLYQDLAVSAADAGFIVSPRPAPITALPPLPLASAA